MRMLSNKPYLIRAFYDWIIDSGCTPFIVINADFPHSQVPQDYVENGEIILNIAPTAIRDLKMANQSIEFYASFSGIVHRVFAPVGAVLAIYAQENQQGMFFDYENGDEDTGNAGRIVDNVTVTTASKEVTAPNEIPAEKSSSRPSHLKLVE